MSDFQARTCELVKVAPDAILKPIFELLSQMLLLNGDAYEDDTAYLESIPGYMERVQKIVNAPDSEWVHESEVVW